MSKYTRAAGAGPRTALALGFLLTMLSGQTGIANPAAAAPPDAQAVGVAAAIQMQVNHPAAPAGAAAGRTPGRFSVGQSGAATYRIPLWNPPGVGRVEPGLALVYDSRSGNGTLGVGWSLEGFSTITRCNRSWAQDGAPAPVSNALLDRFCLDGQPLKLTSAPGTHGQPGSTYATEIESFARVTAHGVAGAGPASFTVTTRNGLVYEYGTTADSRIHAGSTPTVRTWALARVRDRAGGASGGNAVAFRYANDAAAGAYTNGSFRIAAIDYPLTATGTGPFYTVEFNYGQHSPDATPSGFLAGHPLRDPYRLERIDVREAAGRLLRSTLLDYEQGAATGVSRLSLIQECSPTQCLAPTRVAYRDGARGWTAVSSAPSSLASNATAVAPFSADLDGDGLGDLVYPVKAGTGQSRWWVAFGTASGFGAPVDTGAVTQNYTRVLVGRFDGGSASQLLVALGASVGWHVLRYVNGRFEAQALGILGASEFLALDYDGDGLDDLASVTGRSITIRRNLSVPPGPVSFAASKEQVWQADEGADAKGSGGGTSLTSVTDFDGDGRADVAVAATVASGSGLSIAWHVLRSQGFGRPALATRIEPYVGTSYLPLAGDWNADGCSDLLANTRVLVSDCAGSFVEIPVVPASSGVERVAADWDGDGRTDLLHLDSTARSWTVQRSTGSGVEPPQALWFNVASKSNWFVGDFDGDGLVDLGLRDASDANRLKVFRHSGVAADLAETITDGYGQSVTIRYVPITQGAYTPGSGATFPYADYRGPLSVVERYTATTGSGGTYQTQLSYAGARLHLQGRGFAGFESRTAVDSRDGVRTVQHLAQAHPYTGLTTRVQRLRTDGKPLATWDGALAVRRTGAGSEQREFPFVETATTREFEQGGALDGQLITESTVSAEFDEFGNPTRLVQALFDRDSFSPFSGQSWGTTTTAIYRNEAGPEWCLGLPTSSSVTRSAPGQPDRTQRVDYEVDTSSCRVVREVREPLVPHLRVSSSLEFDGCGNPSAITVQGANPDGSPLAPRSTRLEYGSRCQLPVLVRNALGETAQVEYDYGTGQATRLIDANGLATEWQYDAFGRPVLERRPDGTSTALAYESCSAGPCWGVEDLRERVSLKLIAADGTDIRSRWQFFDGWNRLRHDQSHRALGAWTVDREVRYDAFGRASQVQQPYDTRTTGFAALDYDLRGRVRSMRLHRDDGSQHSRTDVDYAGRSTTVTDALGRARQYVRDPRGLLRRVVDPAPGGSTQYDYDAIGQLVRVVDPIGATSTATYDGNGFRTRWTDADAGDWRYTGNSLGELVAWTDGNGKSFGASYDLLGRMISRQDPEGTSTFAFGTSAAAREIGRLIRASGHGLTETRAYDAVGRLASRNIASDQSYRYDFSYNALGLLDTISYPQSPAPTGQAGQRLRIQYGYSFGHPVRISDVTEPAARALWTLDQTQPDRQPTVERLGGSAVTVRSAYTPWTGELVARRSGTQGDGDRQDLAYQWNEVGELSAREERRTGRTESFQHDALGRLVSARIDGAQTLALRYDASGNLLERNGTVYQYGGAAAPHRLTAAGSRSFAYDGNGNARSINGVEQYWTSYGLPSNLRVAGRQTRFSYGPNRELWRQIAAYSNGTESTTYVGGLLEKVQATSTGIAYWRHYVPTPTGQAVVVSRSSAGTGATSYLLADHLGSSDVVLDEAGGVRVRQSFDALGGRRGSDWSATTAPDLAGIANTTRRGYTGHDSIDNQGLVHMGGRVYDPGLGRFLSADPLIGNAGDSQSLNPYAYVGNRPLEYTDPTGLQAVDNSRGLREMLSGLTGFAFYGQYASVVGTRRGAGASMSAVVPGISAQNGVAPCGAGNRSASCSGAHGFLDESQGIGTGDDANHQDESASASRFLDPGQMLSDLNRWWSTERQVAYAGRMTAVAWDGDPDSPYAVRYRTETNGALVARTVAIAAAFSTLWTPAVASATTSTGAAALIFSTGANVTPRSVALAYRTIGAGGRTFVTELSSIEKVIGPIAGRRIAINRARADSLENALGLRPGSLEQTNVISIVEHVCARAPACPISGNALFRGGGAGLPGGGAELTINGIPSAGGTGIRQLILEVVQ